MIVDHVAYQVWDNDLHSEEVTEFFWLIGMKEVDPSNDILEKGYDVRWFAPVGALGEVTRPLVHLVGSPEGCAPLYLSHFCVMVGVAVYEACRRSDYVEHDSGSGRVWLCGPLGLRVEVRP